MTHAAVEFSQVTKRFRVYRERHQTLKERLLRTREPSYTDFVALDGIDLEVPVGVSFGVVGSNGAGKSTLLKLASGVLAPDKGAVATRGRVGALLELGSGFHGELSGRENIFLNGTLLGFRRRELRERFDSIVAFSGLESHIDVPVKNYSTGMVARLGFSIAVHIEPEVLILDEVLAVGDESFQRRCREKVDDLRSDGRTVLLVTHALSEVSRLCDQAVWIDKGRISASGPVDVVLAAYHEAYKDELPHEEWPGLTVRISCEDTNAVTTDEFDSLAMCRFVVDIELEDGVAPPVGLRISLRTADNVSLASIDVVPEKALSQPGSSRLVYEIPALDLLGGPHYLSAHAIDEKERLVPVAGNEARLYVRHPYRSGTGHGVVDLNGAWL
jgi:ABC-type polysaccharide/polyol phosphate transport system ATPase subunit